MPVSLATLRLVAPSGVDPSTVVVPGEATWLVDGAALAFTPESAFAGTRPWQCDGLSPPRGTRSNRQQRESDAQLHRKVQVFMTRRKELVASLVRCEPIIVVG